MQPVAYQRVAAALRVPGQFNVNSTSVAAWRAMLGNLRSTSVPYIGPGSSSVDLLAGVNNPLPRMSVTHLGAGAENSRAVLRFGSLTDEQLTRMATEIVREVKARGPFLSLSEFVNRRLSPVDGSNELDPSLRGAIASALKALENIDKSPNSKWNPAANAQKQGKPTTPTESFNIQDPLTAENLLTSLPLGEWKRAVPLPGGAASTFPDYIVSKAAEGTSTFGLPGWPRQADVLERLAPVITVRDDTFVVRAMGTSPLFNGASGSVWCEAVYQRLPEYVDASVPAHEAPAGDVNGTLTASRRANAPLGRRMRLVSFRWLNSKEL